MLSALVGWERGGLIRAEVGGVCVLMFEHCQGLQSVLSLLYRKAEVSGYRGSPAASLSEAQRPASGGRGGQSSVSEPNLSRNGQFVCLSEFGSSVFL